MFIVNAHIQHKLRPGGLYLRVQPVVGWPSTRLSALRAGGVRQARGENPARTPLTYKEAKISGNVSAITDFFSYPTSETVDSSWGDDPRSYLINGLCGSRLQPGSA